MKNIIKRALATILVATMFISGGLDNVFAGLGLVIEAQAAEQYVYTYYPACSSTCTSIVDGLNSIGVDSSFSNRKKIAALNGYSDYTGTATQNITLLSKLKSGKLIKSKRLASVPATKINLNYTSYTGTVGTTVQLTAKLTPSNSTSKVSWTSSNKNVATVNSKGLVTIKKSGYAYITAKTDNNKSVRCKITGTTQTIKVSKVTVSPTNTSVSVGKTKTITAKVSPVNATNKTVKWASSNTSVATVSSKGVVTGKKAGTATITATCGGKQAKCVVKVIKDDVSIMMNRIKNNTSLGLSTDKKDAIVAMGTVLLNDGFEPAFVAGVLGNIVSEGTVGKFESSSYITHPEAEPAYLVYMDKNYSYRTKYSGKIITQVSLTDVSSMLDALERDGWKGKFGLGCVQWTGSRTKTLVNIYKQYANGSTITISQARSAEGKMLSTEFKGDYKNVYSSWNTKNAGALKTANAAYEAGKIVCTDYEKPADRYNKAPSRGETSKKIYNVMMGK